MAEKIACGYFLLLRNKKTDLYGRGPRMAHMAEKIACGYFLYAHCNAPRPIRQRAVSSPARAAVSASSKARSRASSGSPAKYCLP